MHPGRHHLRLLRAGAQEHRRGALAAVGKVVDQGLCEHFALTRQELFDIVAVHGYRRFAELVAAHGTRPRLRHLQARGRLDPGLASQRPRPRRRAGALQDTNDHFLANIQRNGTYSVVPRIPGGEITPEKLIVIGEVARDFGLYTKITGGQRIDLFGARVEQLPAIWRRLVDAGFESGHAYGKALRTVKSCVGSTWCRYGVQDSVGLAIDLELRYRGLRSPHKLKGGVTGCARECAEARSKDFGVIATEKGWNLYVGGNGGADPGTPGCSPATSTPRRWSATSTGSSCTTSAPPTGCSAPPPGWKRSRAASTTSARSSSTTRSGSAPSSRRRWPATSGPTPTSGARPSTTRTSCAGSSRSSTPPGRPTRPSPSPTERDQIKPAAAGEPVVLAATIPVGAP